MSIFTKIIAGQIPCHRLYEDERVFAFLDIGPLSTGHTLVVPKEEKAFLHELSEESAAAIGRALPRIARAVLAATGATAYNLLQNNGTEAHQVVMHVHFHIIPRHEGKGLGLEWRAGKLDGEAGRALAERIRAALAAKA